jgi:cellulose synthase/poly-beta-1,6-N-acetylglucosamine synthase-like glycosyltransferase
VLIIDGNSSDETVSIAETLGAQVVKNPMLHAASARKIGIIEATSPIVAFTDSDCLPGADWLESIARRFTEDPELDGVGGPVLLSNPKNQIQAYSAHVFENIKSFPENLTYITQKKTRGFSFPGANCAFRRDKVLEVGNFREEFSNLAEEVDLLWRLVEINAKLLFDPGIKVEHLGYPDTLAGLIKTNFRYGATSTQLAKFHNLSPRIDWSLYKILVKSQISTINPFNKDKWAPLRVVQLSAFIAAKWYTSVRIRTINL